MSIWIKELLKNMDIYANDSVCKKIMGACGKTCPFTHLSDEKLLELKNNSKDDKEFLEYLTQHWRVKKENGEYFVVFDKCYCPLVYEDLEGVSKTLCYCSLGNIERKMEIGLDQDVAVIMQKTILAGDDECRFHIKLFD